MTIAADKRAFNAGTQARAPSFAAPLLFLFLQTGIWTIYGTISNDGALHPDMLEAYLWGHEFQLGYYKHPPLWAWLAGAWFEFFPRTNWAFYLLSALNSAVAVIGVWRLVGLFTTRNFQIAATFLLFATPFYTFSALKFNANAMLLSLWPWTVYFFVLSIETASLRSALWFGACAAAALLSKYYSALLLASCIMASFCHPNWKRYYLSAAPYLAVTVCLLLLTPHIVWLLTNDFPTVQYVKTRGSFPTATIFSSVLTFVLGGLAFNSVVAVLILICRVFKPKGNIYVEAVERQRQLFLGVLATGPFLLSVLIGLIFQIRLSTNFAIPIFFLFPLLIIQFLRPDALRLRRLALGFTGLIYALAIPVALSVPLIMVKLNKRLSVIPSLEIAREATRRWHEATAAPLRIVGGTWPYGLVTAFYSGDETEEFTDFNTHKAPWITPKDLSQFGLLAVCGRTDDPCKDRASKFASTHTQTVEVAVARDPSGYNTRPESFLLYITPPK